MNVFRYQSNEKYLNLTSKINRNIQRKKRKKEWI